MPEFIFTHRFPTDFKGAPDTAAAALAWFDQIASSIISRNDLSFETRKIGDCGNTTEPNAYTIVRADDLETAVAVAGSWPLLERGGGIEVRGLTTKPFSLR